MSYLPILLLSIALLGVVVLMAGDREKGKQAALQIGGVVVGMIVLALLLGVILDRAID